MSKYKLKTNENLKIALSLLQDARDRIEGEYSNIPGCCVETFVAGRTYLNFYEQLSSEKDRNRLDQWEYVPCDDCFKKNKKNKISMNGTSDCGSMLLTIMQLIKNKEKS